MCIGLSAFTTHSALLCAFKLFFVEQNSVPNFKLIIKDKGGFYFFNVPLHEQILFS